MFFVSPPTAGAAAITDSSAPKQLPNGDVVSSITTEAGKTYTLTYRQAAQDIQVQHAASTAVVSRIPRGHDPSLVGAATRIRFLPNSLQPYESRGDLLFIATQRTRAGRGMGLCGAGVETYLDVLDIRHKSPKVTASLLVDSCARGISLRNNGDPDDTLYSFDVEGGRLSMRFLAYEDMTRSFGIRAVLSDDLKRLLVMHIPR
ncbi:MAG TPA: hypothetical protein VFR20_07545 [Burkholderiaceae bacterium]|nr:hypothetical protein [Burkholderiaceae bacterium]